RRDDLVAYEGEPTEGGLAHEVCRQHLWHAILAVTERFALKDLDEPHSAISSGALAHLRDERKDLLPHVPGSSEVDLLATPHRRPRQWPVTAVVAVAAGRELLLEVGTYRDAAAHTALQQDLHVRELPLLHRPEPVHYALVPGEVVLDHLDRQDRLEEHPSELIVPREREQVIHLLIQPVSKALGEVDQVVLLKQLFDPRCEVLRGPAEGMQPHEARAVL